MTNLAQLDGRLWIADGGLETTLAFQNGVDLPDFAAFPLLTTATGRDELTTYYRPYLAHAQDNGIGMVVDTPTWRASVDWGLRAGFDRNEVASINADSVRFVRENIAQYTIESVVNGVIGPRGDGYVVGSAMSEREAQEYHVLQAHAFAEAGADMITAVTMTYAAEALGITRAAQDAGMPVAVSFTVETDGRLPSGQPLSSAIEEVDWATDHAPAYFMVNCAHPAHFRSVLDRDADWIKRIRGIRANASRASHTELDNAEELDRGNPFELASDYLDLASILPGLALVGGCCGTDHEHIALIADRLTTD